MLEKVRTLASQFDVLHFHVDVLHYSFLPSFIDKTVTTLHGRLDLAELKPLYATYGHAPLVSISHNQRAPMPPVNWVGNVYHGLPPDLLPFTAKPHEGYLAFLGRIAPEKRPDRAIEIAARAGVKLKMAAKIDRVDQAYWDGVIKPMVDSHPNVEFIGEINERQKAKFIGEASALLFPIDWPEPFGLVMIEAMACGTPVIACRSGSTPEVIDDGVTGFLVDDVEAAAAAVARLPELDRAKVRARFDERFAIARVAEDYLKVYQRIARRPPRGSSHRAVSQGAARPLRRAAPARAVIVSGTAAAWGGAGDADRMRFSLSSALRSRLIGRARRRRTRGERGAPARQPCRRAGSSP